MERQRNLLALAAIYQSNNQPFSAATAAARLVQVARAPDATTCAAATNNEPVPMAPASSPGASSGPPRLYAVPVPLAIIDVVPEVSRTNELVAAKNKIKMWKAVLTAVVTRLDLHCANMSPEAIDNDGCVKGIRSKIAVLETRIIEVTSPADEITDAMFDASMN